MKIMLKLPALNKIQPFVHEKESNVWSMAIGIGPLYHECPDMRVHLSDKDEKSYEVIASLLARRAARAVVDAISPFETPKSIFILSERYKAEIRQTKLWDNVVSQILDTSLVRKIMEQ